MIGFAVLNWAYISGAAIETGFVTTAFRGFFDDVFIDCHFHG
jgi:hypothetical protein